MKVRALGIQGAYEVVASAYADARGLLAEWYRHDLLEEVVGRRLDLAQANMSVSAKGVLRGIHFADVPPGQAKYVTCIRGAVLDVVVDVRVGSPTFGRWEATRLDDVDRRAVFLTEGLGHGFLALTDDATVAYLCSSTYSPTTEHGIDPFDPDLGIDWPTGQPRLSARDAASPSLASMVDRLPSYEVCRTYFTES